MSIKNFDVIKKEFRCNSPAFRNLFFMRSPKLKKLQPRYRDSYRDGSYTLPFAVVSRVVWPAKR